MVKVNSDDYSTCNTTIGTIVTAIEQDISNYITKIDTLLTNNQMGNNKMQQMEIIHTYMQTAVQGVMQTIEGEKNMLITDSVTMEDDTDIFL